MASLEYNNDSGINSPNYCSEELERSRVEKRKAKNREKKRRFRTHKVVHLSQIRASTWGNETPLLESALLGKKKTMDSCDR